jgi:hypothetical protein
MQCDPKKFKIKNLVASWNNRSLSVNLEYQRGASWGRSQQQGLVDSVFRNYPIPRLFLHKIVEKGLGDTAAIRFEIVDGQQRIRAFADYFSGQFELLSPDDKQLRLPNSLRSTQALWAGRKYSQLDESQRQHLDNAEIDAFVITETVNPDEIRDLFIRLQSGTALNRQQVRDAWPGGFGPFIEDLAGKVRKEPSIPLFGLVDRRSDRGDDDDDNFTVNRQVCAQLFTIFQSRLRDPLVAQSISADDLDRTYHANTGFDPAGPAAARFVQCLKLTTAIFLIASNAGDPDGRSKRKFKKLDVISVLMLVQDLTSNPLWKQSSSALQTIANHVINQPPTARSGKATSGRAIQLYYQEWREQLPSRLGIHLDAKRLFDGAQKSLIHARDGGKCKLCETPLTVDEGEYDHFPIPHYLGGRTEVENGRLVCTRCHPRGVQAGAGVN